MHKIIGFADHLHVAILDTVVHHFHIVPSPIGTDVGGARNSPPNGIGEDITDYRIPSRERSGGSFALPLVGGWGDVSK